MTSTYLFLENLSCFSPLPGTGHCIDSDYQVPYSGTGSPLQYQTNQHISGLKCFQIKTYENKVIGIMTHPVCLPIVEVLLVLTLYRRSLEGPPSLEALPPPSGKNTKSTPPSLQHQSLTPPK